MTHDGRGRTVQETRRSVLKSAGMIASVSTIGLAGCVGNGNGDFPNQSIRLIVPYSEGGGTDVFARQMAPILSDELGENIEVDNVEGAAGLRGIQEATADSGEGHTMVMLNPPAEVLASLREEQEQIRDLSGVGIYGGNAWTIIANPEHEVEDIDDLLDRYADGEFTDIGGQQPGSPQHAMAHIMRDDEHNWQWQNYVAYTGTGPITQSVASGEIPAGIGTENGVQDTVESGEAEVVAVLASDGSTVFPDVEPSTEYGYPNIDFIGFQDRAMYAPPDVPDEELDVLTEALEATANDDEMQQWSEETGNLIEWGGGREEAEQTIEQGFEDIEENMDIEILRED